MSLNSLSQAMPALQSALPSRTDSHVSTNTSAAAAAAAVSNASGRSASGSSTSSLRTGHLHASVRQQQPPAEFSSSTPTMDLAVGPPGSDYAASRAAQRQRGFIYANPPTAFIYGVPVTVFVATCISMGLNLVSIILLASSNCSFGLYQVRHMFGFLILAQIAQGSMLLFNIFHHRYHNTCSSLSLSFIFSGSAALLIFGLFETLVSGLCRPAGTPDGGILVSKYLANYAVWFMTLLSVAFHVVAHFYYG